MAETEGAFAQIFVLTTAWSAATNAWANHVSHIREHGTYASSSDTAKAIALGAVREPLIRHTVNAFKLGNDWRNCLSAQCTNNFVRDQVPYPRHGVQPLGQTRSWDTPQNSVNQIRNWQNVNSSNAWSNSTHLWRGSDNR